MAPSASNGRRGSLRPIGGPFDEREQGLSTAEESSSEGYTTSPDLSRLGESHQQDEVIQPRVSQNQASANPGRGRRPEATLNLSNIQNPFRVSSEDQSGVEEIDPLASGVPDTPSALERNDYIGPLFSHAGHHLTRPNKSVSFDGNSSPRGYRSSSQSSESSVTKDYRRPSINPSAAKNGRIHQQPPESVRIGQPSDASATNSRRRPSTSTFGSTRPRQESWEGSSNQIMSSNTATTNTPCPHCHSCGNIVAAPTDTMLPLATTRSSILPRRFSQFNPFDRDFSRPRQSSSVGPGDAMSGSSPTEVLADAAKGVSIPAKAYTRTKSMTASFSGFRNPFGLDSEAASSGPGRPTRPGRLGSAPLERRQSSFQRMYSVIGPEPNPIPKQYRSRSVSSIGYFMSPLKSSNTKLPIFDDDIETQKDNIQEYLAAVELLQAKKTRKPWESNVFKLAYFFVIVAIVYFVVVGQPIWPGVAVLFYQWLRHAGVKSLGFLIFMGWAALQSFLPLLTTFEQDVDDVETRDASETALIIPAYKAAAALPKTIEAALRIFKAEQIFVINNGNTPAPTDDTADVCAKYGVNHAWVPIGSKIVAEFVGVALAKPYKYIMLIDDDVHLPHNLPIVTNRINEKTKCIGYTIKSTGANGTKGTQIQQCQDMEYKASGLTRTFASKYGSATFPHGAIILWDREVLQDLFNVHPGYTISEDWYFGHAARSSGYRIGFCSQVFVATETPPNFIMTCGSARGGFGEMTVYKQRFGRWNYFFTLRVWEDTIYILFSWRLGFWKELVTKIWVLVEIYDSVMAFLRPFIIVITAIAAWRLLLIFGVITMAMYLVAFVIFNAYHLRRKNEMVAWKILPMFIAMKFALLWVNSLSVYYGLYDYARFFSKRHEKVIENKDALEAAYNVRLGQNLVPLDTKYGEAVREVTTPEMEMMVADAQAGLFGAKVTEGDLFGGKDRRSAQRMEKDEKDEKSTFI